MYLAAVQMLLHLTCCSSPTVLLSPHFEVLHNAQVVDVGQGSPPLYERCFLGRMRARLLLLMISLLST